ncbi:MAG: hypothetical protein CSB02_00510 [Bacteroidia bacterium]|nr:MAG: hypothetical protein CSB02_00510 [Bacteroidia bacterium]
MKKLLLFALAAGIGVSAYAQNRFEACTVKSRINDHIDMSTTKAATSVKPKVKEVQVPNPKGRAMIEQVKMGMSGPYGVYSVLIGEQRPLSYVPALDLVSFTHRGEENEHPGTDNSTIVGSWQAGIPAGTTTFDNHIVLAESGGQRHRYPSGQLFNPAGNNDANQSFLVAAGPSISANGDTWDQNFFASSKLDGSANNLETPAYTNPHPSGSELVREGLSVANNGDVLIATATYDVDGNNLPIANYNLVNFSGTKSGDSWTWERHTDVIVPSSSSDGVYNCSLREGEIGAAYSKDGSIGYKWATLQKASDVGVAGIQPVVFYTEDAGVTWTEIEYGTLVNNPVMSEYLFGINEDGTGAVWPRFKGGAGVVDANGNLQMFSQVHSSTGSSVDSIWGHYYRSAIYNVTFSKTGLESVIYVDSIVGIKDPSEGVSWGDTPNAMTDYEGFNAAPDIKATGRSINDPTFHRTDLTDPTSSAANLTAEDVLTGTYRFNYAAPVGKFMKQGEDGFLLTPMSTSISLTEFEGASDDSPSITHSMLNVDGLGQNQPNPFTGTTTITVNSNTIAPVSVEVSNIMGQTVFTQNEGTINGSKQITIDASNLQAGIYFYTVRVGAESQTKKMMVK